MLIIKALDRMSGLGTPEYEKTYVTIMLLQMSKVNLQNHS